MNRPFFIVGSGRSGTTLLRMVLTNHSRICIPPETWFLLDLVEKLPLQKELSPPELDQAIELMVTNYRWPDLDIDKDRFAAEARALEGPTVRKVVELVYTFHMERDDARRWGDKTPTYVRIVPQLARLYPEARFIHLIRDGHDVAMSMHAKRWNGRWLAWNAREWIEAIDLMRAHRETLPEERLIEIRYEDLVLDLESVTRRICEFLGEDFEPAMLEWAETVTERVPDRELVIHQKLFRKPRPEDIHRWRSQLSASRTFVLESYIGSRLRAEGYPVRFAAAGWRPLLGTCRLLCVPLLPTLDFLVRLPGALSRRLGRILGGAKAA